MSGITGRVTAKYILGNTAILGCLTQKLIG